MCRKEFEKVIQAYEIVKAYEKIKKKKAGH